MNIPVFIINLAEVILIITEADGLLGWKWSVKPKQNRWNWHHSQTDYRCVQGQCVETWNCPRYAVAEQVSSNCVDWSSGQMVCCTLNLDENFHSVGETVHYFKSITPASNQFSKTVTSKFSAQATRATTDNYIHTSEGSLNTPYLEHIGNSNSKERPTPISSLGDILNNAQNKFTTHKSYDKVTNNHHGDTHKRTSLPKSIRTTVSGKKPPASESNVIFPTESSWTRKTTEHREFSSKLFKNTVKPTKSYTWFPRSNTTTIAALGHTSKSAPRKTGSPSSDKSSDSKSHTWSVRSTSTIAPWRRNTGATTRSRFSGMSTVSTVPNFSDERRNQGWGKATSIQPTGRQTNPRYTNRAYVTSSTARTTKRYRSTTSLPNVNEFLCGIRNQPVNTRRQSRSYYYEHKPNTDVVYTGTRSSVGRVPYERIVGGKEAEPYSWPWVAALYKVTSSGGNRFLSAGTLINENFVLTAAHVFTPEDLRVASFVVMLGTHDAQDAVAEYLVASVMQHPRYEQRYYYHDIALLKLNKPVVFNKYVMPVCLPSPDAPLLRDRDLEGKNVTVMGWGDDSFGGKSSRVLKEATFPVVSRVYCNTSYVRVASNRFPKGITNDMLCAGDPNGGQDACQGDSGGPLTSMENGRYTQVGIVSFGYKCGDKEFPGVYTKVAPYLNWIAENSVCNEDYVKDYEY